MLRMGRVLIGLSVLMFMASCGLSSYEQQGNASYKRAQRLTGNEKLIEEKTAYVAYQSAISAHPDNISSQLRSRFVELSLNRAKMVLEQGNSLSDALGLHMRDIEHFLGPDGDPDVKNTYANLLIQLADSQNAKSHFEDALVTIDKAISYAKDPSALIQKKQTLIGKSAKENFETAQVEMENYKQNKDPDALIRAEYYVQAALCFDPKYEGAEKLLSDLRKQNVGTYSGYLKVIEPINDSVVFRKVNKWDILLAMPTVGKGSTWTMSVNLYNYSFNPLRLKAENFFLVDKDGKKFKANPSQIDPEILDQEHEAKFNLSFSGVGGDIVKLVYDNPPHLSEKYFY
jgi:hypothetical protein